MLSITAPTRCIHLLLVYHHRISDKWFRIFYSTPFRYIVYLFSSFDHHISKLTRSDYDFRNTQKKPGKETKKAKKSENVNFCNEFCQAANKNSSGDGFRERKKGKRKKEARPFSNTPYIIQMYDDDLVFFLFFPHFHAALLKHSTL